jgi:methyl-accepting chemotaxis protein
MILCKVTIQTRLRLVFGILAVMVLTVSGMALKSSSDATSRFSAYIHGVEARANMVAEVRMAVDRRAIAARNLVLVTSEPALSVEKAAVTRAHRDVQARLSDLKRMMADAQDMTPRGRELVANIDRIETAYGPVATAIAALALDGRKDEAIAKMDNECRPLLAALIGATDAYAAFTRNRAVELERDAAAKYAMQRTMQIALSLVAVCIAAWAGIFVTRSIVQPIRRAVEVARTVAQGDLRSRISISGHDEARDLLEALQTMNQRLSEIVSNVRDTSGTIAGAVNEIATGNADLSQRTEQQAASLQETASSMEELTSTVRQNAENAQQASALALSASQVAGQGSEVVSRVVQTMAQINRGSTKIAEITGIIEGIAFQTNILALNAAVEAARAGEEGRGFAVVASEVRSLAQRSSAAAKEIKGLITESVCNIHAGSSLVEQAGGTMTDLNSAVARVTDIMGEIAAASNEQSRGIEQVNRAITQMDDATQQNSALVEQAAAASRSLETQGNQLREAVAAFAV